MMFVPRVDNRFRGQIRAVTHLDPRARAVLPGGWLRITFVESLLVPVGIDGSFVTNGVISPRSVEPRYPELFPIVRKRRQPPRMWRCQDSRLELSCRNGQAVGTPFKSPLLRTSIQSRSLARRGPRGLLQRPKINRACL